MKKFCGLLALLLGVSVYTGSAHAAVSAGAISAETKSNTMVNITVDTAATELDSLYICYFTPIYSTDTTFVALLDSTAADTLLTGLTPSTHYAMFMVARDSDSKTSVSAKDSVFTYQVQVGDVGGKSPFMVRKVGIDSSWPYGGNTYYLLDTVFDLDDVDASDYSMIYYAGEYNGIDVLSTQAGDSTVASVYFYPVHIGTSRTDSTLHRGAVADSVNITAPGLKRETVQLPVGQYYQMMIYTFTGNGQNADYEIYLTSDGVR